ncbi:MAG: acyl-CoA dehydrogenase family protein [Thermoleophilia bacterium]|nr:acyl-CoA dehydrogenase family protein [Thermoleophilia bacterium]
MQRLIFEDEHNWFRESVETFVKRELAPRAEQIREQRLIDREIWQKAGQAGFLGVGIPEEFGGNGARDFRFNAVLQEEWAYAGAAYQSSFGIHTDVCAPYLTDLCNEEQQERWLPKFVTGETITAIGMTEANAGSDLAAIKTAARRNPAGDGWIVNGSKTFITNGYQADLVIAAVQTTADDNPSGRPGITLMAIEQGMPGFTRGRKLLKIGQHEADTAELFFEDVELPDANVIGEVGRGFAHMMEGLAQERLSSAVGNIAHAAVALERTLEYTKQRSAFGRPVGTFQHNRFLQAELVTEVEVTQAYVDQCIQRHSDAKLDPVDAAKAKWWTSDVQGRVLDACVQLHGGYGFMEEYDVARAWADARVTRIWAGSNEIMKEIIGRSLGFGEPRP